MNKAIKSIVIIGGGSAGWLVAGRIAAQQKEYGNNVNITLIESAKISTVNVGEGTWPTMRTTLQKIGISESDFINQCSVSFKQGAKFSQWVDGSTNDFYYHPLVLPQGYPKVNLGNHWHQESNYNQQSFSNAVCFQEQICEHGLAPKEITTPEFAGIANYAYHLDSTKFASFLKDHCIKTLSIKHIIDDVINVKSANNGDITSVTTQSHGDISGDLFVDCSGFSSILLGKHLQVPWVDKSDILFVNKAIAVQVPYENDTAEIASHTISTAQDAGWIWDIGLPTRRGVGYVYSDIHQNEQQAIDRLEQYIGPTFKNLSLRDLSINSGHRQVFWKNNCVAVGLSSGFLEPLEASSLVLVEMSAEMIAEQLPACRNTMNIVAKRFNESFLYKWQRIIDFLKLHYILSQRTEPFWLDNRMPNTIPESLRDLLALWQYRSPFDQDFTSNNEVFPAASYQYILYGMGFNNHFKTNNPSQEDKARQAFIRNTKMTEQACRILPKNRQLLAKIQKYGLQHV